MKTEGLKKSAGLLARVAIALLGSALAAHAQSTPAASPSPAAPKPAAAPAVSPQDPLCRQSGISTPIFQGNSTISSALQLVPPNGLVRLVVVPPPGSQFATINQPVNGFIQTAVLKMCSNPPVQTACRRVIANFGINVRNQPTVNSAIVSGVNPGDYVSVVLNSNGSVVSAQADGYNWVQLDLTQPPFNFPSGTGWMVNSPIGGYPSSNLGYCVGK
jgi:uncharacterized protein YgiM (DUF1202 family)